MANYTNTFGGSLKDGTQDTIEGVDWDTEYDNVETAIATKANKDTGDNGELVELTAAGDILAAGPLATNLTGLTSNLQTQITAAIPPQNNTGYQPAGYVHLLDGSVTHSAEFASLWERDGGGVGGDQTALVGPTGSGAENIWTAMDGFPSTARIAIVNFQFYTTGGGAATPIDYTMSHAPDNNFPATPRWPIARHKNSGPVSGRILTAYLPLDANNIFYWTYSQDGSSGGLYNYMYATIQGYITTL